MSPTRCVSKERRQEEAGRILSQNDRESNVEFLLPYETVVAMWQECVHHAYMPEAVYARFDFQTKHTYPHRKQLPVTKARVNAANIGRGLSVLARICWHVGICSDYRHRFWRMACPHLRRGDIETVIHVAVVAHHLILFARDCAAGQAEKCFYNPRREEALPVLQSRSEPAYSAE